MKKSLLLVIYLLPVIPVVAQQGKTVKIPGRTDAAASKVKAIKTPAQTDTAASQVKGIKLPELLEIIRSSRQPMLMNFWATWCVPCIEELPYFVSQAAAHRSDSLELVLVSLDMYNGYPAGIDSLLAKRKIIARVLWLDEHDADYFCPAIDSTWSGAIPASLFVNPRKNYRHFNVGQLKEDELRQAIRELL